MCVFEGLSNFRVFVPTFCSSRTRHLSLLAVAAYFLVCILLKWRAPSSVFISFQLSLHMCTHCVQYCTCMYMYQDINVHVHVCFSVYCYQWGRWPYTWKSHCMFCEPCWVLPVNPSLESCTWVARCQIFGQVRTTEEEERAAGVVSNVSIEPGGPANKRWMPKKGCWEGFGWWFGLVSAS